MIPGIGFWSWTSRTPETPEEPEAAPYRGKYAVEHASALVDIGAAHGFAAEHASAFRDITDAGR